MMSVESIELAPTPVPVIPLRNATDILAKVKKVKVEGDPDVPPPNVLPVVVMDFVPFTFMKYSVPPVLVPVVATKLKKLLGPPVAVTRFAKGVVVVKPLTSARAVACPSDVATLVNTFLVKIGAE